jgi:cytochrome c-type biogenesis protein CcmH
MRPTSPDAHMDKTLFSRGIAAVGNRMTGPTRFACFGIVLLLMALVPVPGRTQQSPLKVPDARQFVGAPRGEHISGEALDRRTAEVSALLRCPVCQGLSVGDSPSEMATSMKRQVRDMLALGYSQQQILDYFEVSYGQFVLLEPKRVGVNWIVWIAPIGALLLGALVIVGKMRSMRSDHRARAATFMAEAEADPGAPARAAETDPYLARVRALARGESDKP